MKAWGVTPRLRRSTVDDVLERDAPPDLEQLMRRALGVEAA